MLTFKPHDFTERENYKLLIGSIIPRPIAFVTTISNERIVNAAPFSYFNIVSANPPMISIAIQRKNGGMKDTARNILDNAEFVVHIVDNDNVHDVNQTSATMPAEQSELDGTELHLVPSQEIAVPGIREAKIRFECKLEKHIDLGEGEHTTTDLIIGKIARYHIDDSIYHDGKIDPRGLDAVSRLAGANYATLGDIFAIERPK
jgi:flavin reductase (DIM6/NTAB) family NADH-FMN oxidoreductase RutF